MHDKKTNEQPDTRNPCARWMPPFFVPKWAYSLEGELGELIAC